MIEEPVVNTVQDVSSDAPSEIQVPEASPEKSVARLGDESSAPQTDRDEEDRENESQSASGNEEAQSTEEGDEESEFDEEGEDSAENPDGGEPLNEDIKDTTEQSERTAPAGNQTLTGSALAQDNAISKSKDDDDPRSDLEKQPYDFQKCTVQIAIQLLPDDGGANGRTALVGVRSHLDAPIVRASHLDELGSLPPIVEQLLDELRRELPAREQASREAEESKRIEKMKREAGSKAPRSKSSNRSSAHAGKPGLTEAPATSGAANDDRPRPDVKVPANPQRQIGLF